MKWVLPFADFVIGDMLHRVYKLIRKDAHGENKIDLEVILNHKNTERIINTSSALNICLVIICT